MFKAAEAKRKIREINPLIDMQIKLFVRNFRPLFHAVSAGIVMGLIRN